MDPIILSIGKAQPTGGPIRDAQIHIIEGLPDKWTSMADWDIYCDKQAKCLEDVFINTLPGGVYDRLLGLMLARKATHFRVTHIGANS